MKSLIQHLKSYFSKEDKSVADPPEGLCPNCWGRQEYGGKFYDAIKTENIDTNNIDQKTGWVEAYAEKYLKGIQLHSKDAKLVCNSCTIQYKPSEEKS